MRLALLLFIFLNRLVIPSDFTKVEIVKALENSNPFSFLIPLKSGLTSYLLSLKTSISTLLQSHQHRENAISFGILSWRC